MYEKGNEQHLAISSYQIVFESIIVCACNSAFLKYDLRTSHDAEIDFKKWNLNYCAADYHIPLNRFPTLIKMI